MTKIALIVPTKDPFGVDDKIGSPPTPCYMEQFGVPAKDLGVLEVARRVYYQCLAKQKD